MIISNHLAKCRTRSHLSPYLGVCCPGSITMVPFLLTIINSLPLPLFELPIISPVIVRFSIDTVLFPWLENSVCLLHLVVYTCSIFINPFHSTVLVYTSCQKIGNIRLRMNILDASKFFIVCSFTLKVQPSFIRHCSLWHARMSFFKCNERVHTILVIVRNMAFASSVLLIICHVFSTWSYETPNWKTLNIKNISLCSSHNDLYLYSLIGMLITDAWFRHDNY